MRANLTFSPISFYPGLIAEPAKEVQDIANFSDATLSAVVQVCVDIAGIREKFELTASDSSIRSRFHSAYMLVQEEWHDELVKCLDRGLSPMLGSFKEALEKMTALNLRISMPKLPDRLFHVDEMFQDIAETIRRAYGEPLQDLVDEIAQMRLPEPLLTHALKVSGLDLAILDSPTYVPPVLTISGEESTRCRGDEAHGVLSQVEQSLRDVIIT